MLAQVTLFSKDADERRLLEYLQTAKDSFGKPYYDAQFALRVARQNGRLNACVQLLCELQLHEVSTSHFSEILGASLSASMTCNGPSASSCICSSLGSCHVPGRSGACSHI